MEQKGEQMIKKFNFPSFKEWEQDNYKTIIKTIGAYKVVIGQHSFSSSSKIQFSFILGLNSENPFNLYAKQIFIQKFIFNIVEDRYELMENKDEFKQWYYETIEDFDKFWENYIKSTYLIEEPF
jgi:hypothetical protein